jgi:hypothetical protein
MHLEPEAACRPAGVPKKGPNPLRAGPSEEHTTGFSVWADAPLPAHPRHANPHV